jgi:hypothetical protein
MHFLPVGVRLFAAQRFRIILPMQMLLRRVEVVTDTIQVQRACPDVARQRNGQDCWNRSRQVPIPRELLSPELTPTNFGTRRLRGFDGPIEAAVC